MAGRSSWRRLRRVFRREPSPEIDEELRYHLDQRARDYVDRGMDPDSARRAAAARLGDLDRVRRECTALLSAERRAAERRRWLSVSWLDVKLGARMLVKYPGLTVVAGIGMAVAIAIGATSFGIIYSLLDPALPLEDGDRVIAIEAWNSRTRNAEPFPLHDFVKLRDALRSVEDIAAYRRVGRNWISDEDRVEPYRVTEMTAAGFRAARVPALLGRALLEEDEREAAPPVVVIGHDVWRDRFASDPGILGRMLRLGDVEHTIVGVMPVGFAFPENDRFWTPLRLNPADWDPSEGPAVEVFGRLADGVTLEAVQAEVATVGQRLSVVDPDAPAQFRPRVQPYTHSFVEPDVTTLGWVFHFIHLLISALLVVVCVNVAILMYARTATRLGEITLRNALGASRARIIGQLFVESLVLSGLAALVGLGIAQLTLRQVNALVAQWYGDELPFWLDFDLSAGTVLYVGALVVVAALVVGVGPAWKATGRRVPSGLQRLSGGSAGVRLGRTWTVLIVAPVAFAVGGLPLATSLAWEMVREGGGALGFAAREFVWVPLRLDHEVPRRGEGEAYERAFADRYATLQADLVRRLEADPTVSEVTFATRVPGREPTVWIDVEGLAPLAGSNPPVNGGSSGYKVGLGAVDVGFFDAFEVPMLAGRAFVESDLGTATPAIVVNRSFVEQIGAGANVLGRRIHYVGRDEDIRREDVDPERWYEIVGVVSDFPRRVDPDRAEARVYHPIAPREVYPVNLAARVRQSAAPGFAARLRATAAAVDPSVRLEDIRLIADVEREERRFARMFAAALAAITLSVLLLSAAGIHALMSFTVARRRREIGIRAALGADPRSVLRTIFARAAGQLAIGVVVGLFLGVAFYRLVADGEVEISDIAPWLFVVSALMIFVGALAAFGPAREGLRVQPVEALREG